MVFSQPPGKAFLDGLFNSLGYAFILLIIATVREILGLGTFMGFSGTILLRARVGQMGHHGDATRRVLHARDRRVDFPFDPTEEKAK